MEPVATQEGATVQERLQAFLAPPSQDQEQPKADVNVAEATEEVSDVEKGTEEDAGEQGEEPRSVELSDVAKYLGVESEKLDVDDDGNIIIKTKVDGKEGRAKFNDLLKSYQLEGHLNKQNMEVAEAKKALERRLSEVDEQVKARVSQLEDAANLAYQEMLGEYNAVDWQNLRIVDPAEFAAKYTEFQQRNLRISQLAQKAHAEREALNATSTEKQRARLAEEHQQLLSKIPTWSNQEVASKEMSALQSYAKQEGYTVDEINSQLDHKWVLLLRKAMAYDQLSKSKPAIEKKVREAPKLTKPGVSVEKSKGQDLKNFKTQIQQSGGKKGIAEYLLRAGKV